MKSIILITISLSVVLADTSSSSSSNDSKSDAKNVNSIPTQPQKTGSYYAMPVVQHRPPYIQYVQKPVYVPQQPQATMLIIAQPAAIPQQLLYNHVAQQLLNYFHSNPQAKQQFLQGYTPNFVTQSAPQYSHPNYQQASYQIIAAPSHAANAPSPTQIAYTQSPYQNYQSQYQHYSAQPASQAYTQQSYSSPSQYIAQPSSSYSQSAAYNQPSTTLNQISQYPSLSGQRYSGAQIKTAAPIITGLEHFTPEQQAQIKQHLNSHFASNGGGVPQFGTKYTTESATANDYQAQTDSSKESSEANFAPSQQIYKTHYTKG